MTSTMVQYTAEQEAFLDTASKYLNLYLGEADWRQHIADLTAKTSKYKPSEATEIVKKAIACAVMLPTYDKSSRTDPPQNLLYWVGGYTQFNERDWVKELRERIDQDAKIEGWRNQALSLGIIHPIEYSPVTRQAFNWLFDAAEKAGAVTPDNKADITKRFQNLILAYGGNVICYVFQKEAHKLKKILNWRTGYFFEHVIFEVFNVEQVLKIKKAELAKTNPKLVKRIRQD